MLLLVPVVGCGSSYSSPGSSPSPAPPDGGACNGIDSTSTVNESHVHMVCVLTSDLTNPPAGGATYTTTNVSSHTHTVMLTKDQLAMIESGATVMITSSSTVDPLDGRAHTHAFSIVKTT